MIKFFKNKLIIPIYSFLDNNMGVFLFNNWMFVSNSTINEIEHSNYDIWLKGCK